MRPRAGHLCRSPGRWCGTVLAPAVSAGGARGHCRGGHTDHAVAHRQRQLGHVRRLHGGTLPSPRCAPRGGLCSPRADDGGHGGPGCRRRSPSKSPAGRSRVCRPDHRAGAGPGERHRRGHRGHRRRDRFTMPGCSAGRRTTTKLASANERTRIAREMHDVVAHSLSDGRAVGRRRRRGPQGSGTRPGRCWTSSPRRGRTALADMRRVLGVLRTENGVEAAPVGAAPPGDQLSGLVDGFRAAGLPLRTLLARPAAAGGPAFPAHRVPDRAGVADQRAPLRQGRVPG